MTGHLGQAFMEMYSGSVQHAENDIALITFDQGIGIDLFGSLERHM